MELAALARENVSSGSSPVHGFQVSFPSVASEVSGAVAVYATWVLTAARQRPEEPPNSRARTSPDPALTPEATPSCCFDFLGILATR